MQLPRLLQLADSALPLGGFAFSGGLEWLVKSSHILTTEELYRHCCSVLDQLAEFELRYAVSLYHEAVPDIGLLAVPAKGAVADSEMGMLAVPDMGMLAVPAKGQQTGDSEAKIRLILEDYDAQMFLPLQRKASLAQGAAWLDLLPKLYGNSGVDLARRLGQFEIRHYLPLFVLGLRWSGEDISMEDCATLLLFISARDQLSAAIRLGSIGPSASVELQSALQQRIFALLDVYREDFARLPADSYLDACRINPMTDMALADHANLYAKLFQN